MKSLRGAIIGCGFWSQFQLAAWRDVPGVRIVAVCDRIYEKAAGLATRFEISGVYNDAEEMLARETLDFLDVITDVDTHSHFVRLAARHRLPVICQKPMAPDLATAEDMVQICRDAGVPFMVHENWRWQTPLRTVKGLLEEGRLGRPFRAHLTFCSSFPVFDNQPFLRELDQFILTDVGSHILDAARFLFGEASRLYCQTRRVNPGIKGEDVATVMMRMGDDVTVTCDMSYASRLEHERFPETYLLVECEHGSLELGPDHWIRITTADGTLARRCPPPAYPWADPAYALIHASIVPCHANLAHAIRSGDTAETSGEDNVKTLQLIYGAYESAATGHTITLS
jgi:predicted dehydrogenase